MYTYYEYFEDYFIVFNKIKGKTLSVFSKILYPKILNITLLHLDLLMLIHANLVCLTLELFCNQALSFMKFLLHFFYPHESAFLLIGVLSKCMSFSRALKIYPLRLNAVFTSVFQHEQEL